MQAQTLIRWDSEDVVDLTYVIWFQMLVFCLGFYSWHTVLTFHLVEGRLLWRTISFKWTFIPYLCGRYLLISTLVALVAISRSRHYMNCEFTYRLLSVLGNIVLTCASGNLTLRTFALWKHYRVICLLLTLMALTHFILAIYLGSDDVTSHWDPSISECSTVYTHGEGKVGIFYLYTCFLDFVILVLTAIALVRTPEARSAALWRALLRQGISYFIIAFAVNVLVVIFAWLNLNDVMNIIFTIPGCVTTMMTSSTLVTSLMDLGKDESFTENNELTDAEAKAAPVLTSQIFINTTIEQELDETVEDPASVSPASISKMDYSAYNSNVSLVSPPPSHVHITLTSRDAVAGPSHQPPIMVVDQPILSYAEMQALSEQYTSRF